MKDIERNVGFRNYTGGPHNLGDPDDKSLRKVERDVLIPQRMRDIAKEEKCIEEVKNFSECCASWNVLMVYKCKEENAALKNCLTEWYTNEEFKEECTKQYLEDRSEYRRTGIPKKSKHARFKAST